MNKSYTHEVMETIKIPVVLDGDVAASILNAFTLAHQEGRWEDIIFCGHAEEKVNKLLNKIADKIDIENREEL